MDVATHTTKGTVCPSTIKNLKKSKITTIGIQKLVELLRWLPVWNQCHKIHEDQEIEYENVGDRTIDVLIGAGFARKTLTGKCYSFKHKIFKKRFLVSLGPTICLA